MTTLELQSLDSQVMDCSPSSLTLVAADARVLSKYMRSESLNHKFVFEAPLPTQRLVTSVADSNSFLSLSVLNRSQESQVHTQKYGRRPYGVGLLVIGYDVSVSVSECGQ